MSEHVLPKSLYFMIFVALIVLTAVTTGVAFIDLGPFNTVVALVIAVCKATLVVLFFMHLKYQTGMTRVVILAALLWLAVLIGITMSDVFTRHWTERGAPWNRSSVIIPDEHAGLAAARLHIAAAPSSAPQIAGEDTGVTVIYG